MTRYAVFVFALFMCGAMSVMNAQVDVPKEVQGDEEYYNWFTYPSNVPGGASGFKVHPNGNIIANHDNEFFEISGETGELLRAFPVQHGFQQFHNMDISPDGKYFGYSFGSSNFIIDYASGKIAWQRTLNGEQFHFTADSKHYGIRPFDKGNIDIYDLEGNLQKSVSFNNHEFAFSPDGKFIITHRIEDNSRSFIDLWDFNTFKKITTLLSLDHKADVNDIQFSLDGKYMGFTLDAYDIYIYNLSDYKIVNKYLYIGARFSFLENDLITISPGTKLFDLKDSSNTAKINLEGIGGGGISYNKKLNSIIVFLPGLISLNLEKILAKVSVEENPITSFKVDYKNKLLTISNLSLEFNGNFAKIIDIKGNVVFQFLIQASQEDGFSIPISLPVGAYILQIEGKTDSFKFLVTE